jgi:SAM-dependent methyltransferase
MGAPVALAERRTYPPCVDADGWFGEAVASTYDRDEAAMFEPEALEPAVEFLAALAGDGPALELAIGTGRVALPLAARGVPVVGIELSAAMVARLREKPGGDPGAIPVAIGDMATTVAQGAGSFSLVYLVFNTIMNLATQDAQVACVANAARHLAPGGCFVIETVVPNLRGMAPGTRIAPFAMSENHIGLDEIDVATQGLVSHHVQMQDGRVRHDATPFRYVWPSELDLMARLAGMRLEARFADWLRAPFTSGSASHVSVWRR